MCFIYRVNPAPQSHFSGDGKSTGNSTESQSPYSSAIWTFHRVKKQPMIKGSIITRHSVLPPLGGTES